MLTDTVGFVRHLPTQLVEAFRSTLEEVVDAELLVHVDRRLRRQSAGPDQRGAAGRQRGRAASYDVARMPPELLVVNKTDAADGSWRWLSCGGRCPMRCSSRRTPATGSSGCASRMGELVVPTDTTVDVTIPYDRGELVARMHAEGRVDATEHTAEGTRIKARVPIPLAASLQEFATF